MSHPKNSKLKIATALMLTSLSMLLATPAHAFFWGYSPLTGSTTRMWLSRSLYNPYNLVRGGYSAPYYLANTLGWNAAYAVGQGFNAGKKNQANSISQMKMFGQQGAVDQIAPAKWAAAQNQNQQPFQAPDLASSAPALLAPEVDPFFMPVPMTMDASSSPQIAAVAPQTVPMPQLESGALPAPAPDFRGTGEKNQKHKRQKKHKKQENKNLEQSNNTQEQLPEQTGTQAAATNTADQSTIEAAGKPKNNPFANAFVEHVNAKFGSDINKALSDKETCGYAQAMGLIDDKSKSMTIQPDRVELIRHILQDPAEDSLTKVNTIRMLIKH